ncbi:transmembrane prostate androgen-induced protein [Lynx pardinus]|uniref:Transmembrane prostate androgen-induced protein n=1 Tax=Lynx pardinus TaxID=191816 RepID=A0A485N6K2_LYNPA|nr:transmembrane prostate androgen-induced protein [Lynx pardinus]
MHRLMGVNSTAALAAGQPNVSCTCNCKRSLFQSMEITELEFVEITIIVVVVMVMVVVITCLLSHYKLSARSFIGRHGQGRRREDALSSEGCLWPSESTVSGNGIPEPQVYAPPRPTDRLAVPPFTQRDRCLRFQPTYPYLQHEIDLPPTISLSDGEEPPPYQGPCTLQLRDPEQQLELNRESVRAPPNRTIFDSDLMDSAMLGGPCPPSNCGGRSESPAIIYQQNPINMICQNGPNNYISIENSEDIQIGHGNVIVKPTASGENGSVAPLHLPPMAPADPPTQSSPAAAWAPQDIRLEKSVLRRVLLGHGNEMSLTSAPAEGPAACSPSGSPPVSATTVGSGASFKIPGSKPGPDCKADGIQRVHISSCFLEDTAIGNGNRMTVVSGTAGPGGVAESEDSRRGPEELDKDAGPLSEGVEPRREFPPDPASSLSTNVSKLISHLEAVTLESRDPHNAEDGGRVDRTPDVASQGEVEPRTDSQPLSERAGERQ